MAADGSIDTRAISCCADRISPIDWSCHGYTTTIIIPKLFLVDHWVQLGNWEQWGDVDVSPSRDPLPLPLINSFLNIYSLHVFAALISTFQISSSSCSIIHIVKHKLNGAPYFQCYSYSFRYFKYCGIHFCIFILVNFIIRSIARIVYREKKFPVQHVVVHRLFRSRIRFSVP